ncbi:MAG: CPBP family intramembrane glutamic endopeptidase [Spirochaetota bacterium]
MSKNNKRIVVFLIVTFGLMYVSHGLIAFLLETTTIEWDNFPLNLLGIVGGGAPAFAALFVVYKMYNEEEKKGYWNRVYLFRVSWFWWVVALVSPLLIGAIANVVYHGGWWYPDLETGDIIAFPLSFALMIFAGGVEELGWRGILQDALSKKANLIVTGIVIGVLWGIWHGPLFLIDVFAHFDYVFSTYMLSVVTYSLLLTLVFYKTQSMMLAILMHASINAFGNLGFGIPMEVHGGLFVLFAALIIVFAGTLYFVEKN